MVQMELEELIVHKAKMTNVDENFEKLPLMQKIRLTKAWKPFLILTCYFFLSQFSGMTFVFSYAVNFYAEFAVPLDSFVLSMVHVIVCLCFSFLFTVVVERLNRKTLSAFTAGGAGMTCAAAAVYAYVFDESFHKPFFWFPVACVWTWVGFSVLGLSSLPWLMAGELFPTQVRGIMTSVLWVIVYLYIFSSVEIYALIMPEIKIYGMLIMFSVFSFLAVIFSILVMPETKGKTLIEIEASW
jgi:SP family facilitated glucose transporter-like MFS transporter 8